MDTRWEPLWRHPDLGLRRAVAVLGAVGMAVGLIGVSTPSNAQAASAAESGWEEVQVVAEDPWIGDLYDTTVSSKGRVLTLWDESEVLMGATRATGADHWSSPRRISGKGQTVWTSATSAWGKGAMTVAWQGLTTEGTRAVWIRNLRAGHDWGPIQRVRLTRSNWISLALDRNAAGTALAWGRGRDVYVEWRPEGGRWHRSAPVPVTNAVPVAVSVDFDGHVDAIVRTRSQVFAARLRPDGTWRTPVQVGPRPGARLADRWSVYADSNRAGDLAVAWREGADWQSEPVVGVRRVGKPWSSPHTLPDSSYASKVAVSDAGVVTAAWIAPNSAKVRLQRYVDGAWGDIQPLYAFQDGATEDIILDANGRGDAIVAFHAHPCSVADPCRGWTVVRCIAGSGCDPSADLEPPVSWRYPALRLGSSGEAYAVWGAGCHTEACYYTSVRSRALAPPA